ncbi:MAG: T9SS C-terminal target domain-containing protein, partial [Crocinitomicaceae bacterium]|nr:T9SS C-terminal target domain-containing protein [Crocinitomicaceae bacterium]
KNYLIGSVVVAGACALFALGNLDFSKIAGSYSKKNLSILQEQNANAAMEWMKARYIDVTTGQPVSNEKLAEIQKQISKLDINKNIAFTDEGPDNIGGRTRAIQVDRTWENRLWAGGVSGGLFVSNNKGNSWERVTSYMNAGASPFISSMTQTPDGTLYVSTGSNQESWSGNGVWYSTDFGTTWATVPGVSESTEVESSDADNYVWMATSTGLKKWKLGDPSITSVSVASGGCFALKVSKDGEVIVGAYGSNKTWVSSDGGLTFADKSGTSANNLVPVGAGRIEYSVSPIKNSSNKHSLYAVRTNSNLLSMHVSHDDGVTWTQFVGASAPPSDFDIYRDQGTYNSIVSVVPNNPEQILIGGIDIWSWKQTVNNPPSGGFEKVTQWFVSPSSPIYAHADNHEMKWDSNNRFYIGNDGGVGVTNDYGQTWFPANRGYNVTQFYGIAFDNSGSVMGGTQDNGTLYNDHTNSTYQEFRAVNGGDGFECEISFFNPKVMFSTVYYNSISRSGDRGQTWTSFVPSLPGTYDPAGSDNSPYHPFHSEIVLFENYDLNSKDSVVFIPTKNYASGAVIRIPSLSSGDSITYVASDELYFDDTLAYSPNLTQNGVNYGLNSATGETVPMGTDTVIYNVAWDTLKVQDPFQSWFFVFVNANGGELWGTRNALRLSVQNPLWLCVARGIGGGIFNNVDMEMSKDLNHLYVSAGTGVWRIDGLGSVYTSDPDFVSKVAYIGTGASGTLPTATTATKITNTNYEGLAINPNNANDVILFAGFGGTNRRTLNATSGTPSFTSLGAITTPGLATYDGIIDRNDSDIIVVATSNGVFVTENGGASWENASAGFEGTPCYEIRQSWRSWEEGNGRPGEIYVGTFGRGLWKSTAYLGINESTGELNNSIKTKLKTFPNPTNDNTTLSFNLAKAGDVELQVYSISGRLVKSISRSNVDAGLNTLQIDCEDLTNGTYIVKFASGKQVESVKFIKM